MKSKTRVQLTSFFVYLIICIGALSSCTSTEQLAGQYLYFQNGSDSVTIHKKETVIQPNDFLTIAVFSKTLNQEQAAIFNIPTNASAASTGTGNPNVTSATSNTTPATATGQSYQVSAGGTIEMPVIGTVKAAGLTREQLQSLLVEKITNYVKNPTVIVRFLEFEVNILGEVHSPGTKRFTIDKSTIIDAISAAGDLTDFGRRDNVTVIRERNSKKIYYTIDLRNKNIFSSPIYQLQPNDIVYVAPTKNRLKTLNADTDTQRKIGLYSSFFGIAISILTLIIYLKR